MTATVLRICVAAALLGACSQAAAECQPWGRNQFAAGLEALSAGDVARAGQAFYRLVESQPDCAEAHNNLAVVYVEQGRIEEAQVELRAALLARPDYLLARDNLARLESIATARTPETVATPKSGQDITPSPAATASASLQTPTSTAVAVSTVTPEPSAGVPARPPAVCIIEPAQSRICVHERAAGNAAGAESCYPIQAAEVRTWPRWLVASETVPKRIRLRDETGLTRLEIVAEDTAVTADVLRLQQADFDALATHVVPWTTKWVIVE